jgi:hypothetical protein
MYDSLHRAVAWTFRYGSDGSPGMGLIRARGACTTRSFGTFFSPGVNLTESQTLQGRMSESSALGVKLLSEELGHETDGAVVHPQRQRRRQADDQEGALGAREAQVGAREAQVGAREAQVAAREAQVGAREASRAERLDDARGIRVGADERDEQADGRDRKARKRDMAAHAEASWHQDEDEQNGRARTDRDAARWDRRYAKDDRISSAVDRALLTEDDDPRDGDALNKA